MIKNYRDIIVLLITVGILLLLAIIIVGDYWVAIEENRPVDESIITLLKMSVTGLMALLAVIIGGSKMIDRFMYKILGKLDFLFEVAIPSIYERLKKIRIFFKRKRTKR
jgi:uncharacterized membrane protein